MNDHNSVLRVLKGIAAGLSAEHDIIIRFDKDSDCSTDGRTIKIPYRKEINPLKYLGYLAHEAGHVIYTDFGSIKKVIEAEESKGTKYIGFLTSLQNGLEDIFIEREITNEFEGFKYFLTEIVNESNNEKQKIFDKIPKTKLLIDILYLSGRGYNYSTYPEEIISYVNTKLKHIVDKVANSCKSTQQVIECAKEAFEIIIKDFEIPEGEKSNNFLELLKKEAGDKNLQNEVKSVFEEYKKQIEGMKISKNEFIPSLYEPVERNRDTQGSETIVDPGIGYRNLFEKLESSVHNEVKYIRNQLIRSLTDVRATKWRSEEETGRRLGKNLYKIEKGNFSIFREKVVSTNHELPEMAWYILIDHSGSMGTFYMGEYGNSKSAEACKAAIAFSELANRLELPFAITGFRAGGSNNEESVKHIIYKTFDEQYDKVKVRLTNITGDDYNLDSVSLRFAYEQIKRRREQIKIIVIICDGYPCCPPGKLEKIISEIENSRDTRVVGIGIQTNLVKDFYKRHIEVEETTELGMNVVKILSNTVKELQK